MEKTQITQIVTVAIVAFIAALLGSMAGTYISDNYLTGASYSQQREAANENQNSTDALPGGSAVEGLDAEVRTDDELLQDGVQIDEAAIDAQIRALEEEAAQNNN